MGLKINKYWRGYGVRLGLNRDHDTKFSTEIDYRVRRAEEAIDLLLKSTQELASNKHLVKGGWSFALLWIQLNKKWRVGRDIWFLDTHRSQDGLFPRRIRETYGSEYEEGYLLRVDKDFSLSAGISPFFISKYVTDKMIEEQDNLDKAMRQLHDYVADKAEFFKAFRHTA